MTVSELIAELSKLDGSLPVVVASDNHDDHRREANSVAVDQMSLAYRWSDEVNLTLPYEEPRFGGPPTHPVVNIRAVEVTEVVSSPLPSSGPAPPSASAPPGPPSPA